MKSELRTPATVSRPGKLQSVTRLTDKGQFPHPPLQHIWKMLEAKREEEEREEERAERGEKGKGWGRQ